MELWRCATSRASPTLQSNSSPRISTGIRFYPSPRLSVAARAGSSSSPSGRRFSAIYSYGIAPEILGSLKSFASRRQGPLPPPPPPTFPPACPVCRRSRGPERRFCVQIHPLGRTEGLQGQPRVPWYQRARALPCFRPSCHASSSLSSPPPRRFDKLHHGQHQGVQQLRSAAGLRRNAQKASVRALTSPLAPAADAPRPPPARYTGDTWEFHWISTIESALVQVGAAS